MTAAGTPGAAGAGEATASDFRRVASASGLYAVAALAQQGVSFLLLPLYTRLVVPAEYGLLELLNAFSSIAFALLMAGLPSAIAKCYHRDCATPRERGAVLATAIAIDLPLLLLGGGLLFAAAGPVSRWLLGGDADAAAGLVRVVAATGVLSSLTALVLASLRAQERALAFGVLTFIQFAAAMVANVTLVAGFGLGVRGILWGNLIANAVALPLALAVVLRAGNEEEGGGRGRPRADRRLAAPLLRFGLLLVPVLLAGWVMDLSDRYVLHRFTSLEEVAVYGVGYKLGMVLHLAVVWPFQLAWPAVSFSISHRDGHRETYGRTLTYLAAVMAFGVLAVSLLSRAALPALVGDAYAGAWRVVPLVALGYAFNGVHYCVSPGLHLGGKTRWFPALAGGAAALNLGLTFLLVPRFGAPGAAAATAAAFLGLAAATLALGRRVYPVRYEHGRLARVVAAAALAYFAATRVPAAESAADLAQLARATLAGLAGLAAFPALLWAAGFFDERERRAVRGWLHRKAAPLAS